MLPLLVVLFVVVPIAELAVIIQVGQALGLPLTLGLLVLDSVAGSLLLRWQGRAAWRRFNAVLRSGRPPAREVLDGALIILGGALLLSPGFVTDGVGLLLLFPPTRAGVRRLVQRRLVARALGGGRGRTGARRGPPPDVEASGHDVDTGLSRG